MHSHPKKLLDSCKIGDQLLLTCLQFDAQQPPWLQLLQKETDRPCHSWVTYLVCRLFNLWRFGHLLSRSEMSIQRAAVEDALRRTLGDRPVFIWDGASLHQLMPPPPLACADQPQWMVAGPPRADSFVMGFVESGSFGVWKWRRCGFEHTPLVAASDTNSECECTSAIAPVSGAHF